MPSTACLPTLMALRGALGPDLLIDRVNVHAARPRTQAPPQGPAAGPRTQPGPARSLATQPSPAGSPALHGSSVQHAPWSGRGSRAIDPARP